jgi:outer membrane protein insertion porin family
VQLGLGEGSFLRDTRDDPSDAHRGMYTTADGGLASSIIGSRRNFTRFLITNAGYYPFKTHWVLARRIEFGWIRPFKTGGGIPAGQEVPLPERFFGGGSTSLRGVPDNQAGPRDPFSGFPLGGNALLIHNTELRFPFLGENMNGVLFHDMGNVYSNLSDVSFRVHQKDLKDFNYMVHAVGFGIRYRTPVGPVRVDLAYSVNPPQFFGFKGTTLDVLRGIAPRTTQSVSHFQFFFSIGQAF